eukprot:CAMPEP_0170516896 /NCGR_PEP_ID=MMETSP0209-20121228/3021_1 /TAXON_ID=665100 ORGANISM="Litonotus pictus, Strain P1" /NCGR_SAMPLE_ID=MMETSP0209 /ASSEMBLY_ACC=CAM_ASM_000301 /LENGTH=103 /DNA_ID=CAMNT_0010801983 /DNA_START=45 /DNA_END=356 /DNA_ORIENTATION=+
MAGLAGAIFLQSECDKKDLKNYVYGLDGNGGNMLRIYTYLTDQEMASLRFQKRVTWHGFKLEKDAFKNTTTSIKDEELKDLGIKFPEDRYVEYNKRPPHDFYL